MFHVKGIEVPPPASPEHISAIVLVTCLPTGFTKSYDSRKQKNWTDAFRQDLQRRTFQ